MPSLPLIVPIVIVGLMFGSLLKSERPKISFKRVGLWALVAGALNAMLAYADFLFAPQPTFGGGFTGTATSFTFVRSVSDVPFTIASFLAGFLIVIVVFGIAAVYLRLRGGRAEAEEGMELTGEETSTLQPG